MCLALYLTIPLASQKNRQDDKHTFTSSLTHHQSESNSPEAGNHLLAICKNKCRGDPCGRPARL